MKPHIALLLALCCVTPATAQDNETKATPRDSHIYFVRTSRDTTVYKILKQDRQVNFRDAKVPHFAIHTADNKFVMTIGGYINPIIGFDLGNDLYDISGPDFVTSSIPVPAPPHKKADFFLCGLNAALDFQIVGFGGTANQITGYVKLGTNGMNSAIKLKKAYVTWRGLSMGQKTTLMEDGAVCPPTIDQQGPNGFVSNTAYALQYVSPSWHGLRGAVALEIPTFNSSSGVYRGKDYKEWNHRVVTDAKVCDPEAYNQLVPDIPLWVEWAYSDVNRIRLSGVIRTLTYRDMLEQKRRTSVGWGLMLSGNYSPVNPLIFYAQAVYGKGIGNYIQDLQGIPLSYLPANDYPGKMTPTPEMGLLFGLTYNITPRWQLNAMYSMARIWKAQNYATDPSVSDKAGHMNDYRYANYVCANMFYNISSFFQVGLEYLYGQRKTYGSGSAHDNRIQAQVSFML